MGIAVTVQRINAGRADAPTRQTAVDTAAVTIIRNPIRMTYMTTLVLMAGKGKLVFSERDYQELITFRDARNKLAHLSILDLEAVDYLLRRSNSL